MRVDCGGSATEIPSFRSHNERKLKTIFFIQYKNHFAFDMEWCFYDSPI